MKELEVNTEKIREKLVDFIKSEFKKVGFKRAILGISGGVDSTLTAYLCCEALGKDNVIGMILPYGKNGPDIHFSKLATEKLNIKHELIDISPMIDSYFRRFTGSDRIRRGNKMARERMSILYDQSRRYNALVVGSGNKTEILLGYYTIYGDSACAINPVSTLYKTQVYRLARAVGVPEKIVERRPSAGLWPGQTDEKELGYKYADIDRLLHYMVDKKLPKSKLSDLGFKGRFIEDIAARIKKNKFKTLPPYTIEETVR